MKSFLLISLIGSLLFIAGCNTRLDPDVMNRSDLPSSQSKVIYLKISGTLDASNGDPVPGAKVTAQTSRGTWSDVTTYRGAFRLEAIKREGEPIDFHFTPAPEKSNPAPVKWTVTVTDHDIPKGVSRVTAHFFVEKGGAVRLASMEY